MNKIWTYKGKNYSFDITEESCYALVSRGLHELQEFINYSDKEDFADGCCESIKHFFDTLFEAGAGEAICGRKKSVESHVSAYVSFISLLCAQVEEFSALRTAIGVRI